MRPQTLRKAVLAALAAGLFLLAAGCQKMQVPGEKQPEAAKEKPVQVVPMDTVLSQLPCFQCHKTERFMSGGNGGFSHRTHLSLNIHCNQCHRVQGHSKPMVFLNTCDGCHKLKDISFKTGAMPAKFSHESHAKRSDCNECHPKLFKMKRGSSDITMAKLYQGKLCGSCHNGRKAFSSKQCARCHEMKGFRQPVKFPGGGMQPVVFSHEVHTAMFACKDCHGKLFPMKATPGVMKMDAMNAGKYCGACHNGKKAFASTECQMCHK
ncbi:MAG: cytochrome c3 family protein [Nitrospiraceae bacterium]|nr:cytochrome c3 family protein [Nitrospiraceae bacterium]